MLGDLKPANIVLSPDYKHPQVIPQCWVYEGLGWGKFGGDSWGSISLIMDDWEAPEIIARSFYNNKASLGESLAQVSFSRHATCLSMFSI